MDSFEIVFRDPTMLFSVSLFAILHLHTEISAVSPKICRIRKDIFIPSIIFVNTV